MKQGAKKPLAFARETIRQLDQLELRPVAGAANVSSVLHDTAFGQCSVVLLCSGGACFQPIR
jgi:hypothetical protein